MIDIAGFEVKDVPATQVRCLLCQEPPQHFLGEHRDAHALQWAVDHYREQHDGQRGDAGAGHTPGVTP